MSIALIKNKITDEEGFQVRVKGKTKYFSTRRYGFKEAKQMAETHEQKLFLIVGKPARYSAASLTGAERAKRGILGMHFSYTPSHACDIAYPYVRGIGCNADGKQIAFGYSIEKHGIEGALKLAILARKRMGCTTPSLKFLIDRVEKWLKESV